MNDLVREVVEGISNCYKVLKHMPEFQQDNKRFDRLRSFIRSQKKKNSKPKVIPKLSFEINFDEDDVAISRPTVNTQIKKNKSKNGKKMKRAKRCQNLYRKNSSRT